MMTVKEAMECVGDDEFWDPMSYDVDTKAEVATVLAARIEELEAAVEKLPKTADGKYVTPGTELWSWSRYPAWSPPELGMSWARMDESDEPVVHGDTNGYAPHDFQEYYSTREAALAAKEVRDAAES